jgi:hypothetical protein
MVISDVSPYSFDRCLPEVRRNQFFPFQGIRISLPENGGKRFLRNVDPYTPNYNA